jgi:hypothetical protein
MGVVTYCDVVYGIGDKPMSLGQDFAKNSWGRIFNVRDVGKKNYGSYSEYLEVT